MVGQVISQKTLSEPVMRVVKGQVSRGNFKYDRERAVEAGRAGGKVSKRTSSNSIE